MKSIISKLIFLGFVFLTLSCQNDNAYVSIDPDNKVENLRAFSKLYGYVRYFHPSDEADSIDWNKFLYHGIEQVSSVTKEGELKIVLEDLFKPIAPSIDIYSSERELKPKTAKPKMDDQVLVTWQHSGLGITENSAYQSVRIGRVDLSNAANFMYKVFPEVDYGNKEFKLFVSAEIDEESEVKATIQSYTSLGVDTFYSKIINDGNSEKKLVLEGVFPDDTHYLFLMIGLIGNGTALLDDLDFTIYDSAGKSETLLSTHNKWALDDTGNGIQGWEIQGLGYTYELEPKNDITYVRIKSDEGLIPGAVFQKHADITDVINKELGQGISCQIPLALYLAKEKPSQFSPSFDSLSASLEKITLEETTAQMEPTRIGSVIKAWNILNHFYPYFDVVNTDWDNVLTEALVSVLKDTNEQECHKTLLTMVSKLHDGHGRVAHPYKQSFKRLPILFDYIDEKVIVVASNEDQIQRGDILLEIDGENATKTINDGIKLASGSPQYKKDTGLYRFTSQDSNTVSTLKIKRKSDTLSYVVARKGKIPKLDLPDNISQLSDGIIYINLDESSTEEILEEIDKIAQSKGVIFDLRGYPNSSLDIISHMIDSPVKSPRWQIPNIIYPDQENIVGYDTTGRWTIEPKQPKIQGEIIFLTDEEAISYSESFMSIIEHYKLAEIVGSPTAGTNGNVNPFTTMGGFEITWTGMKVLKHDSSQHHLIGIQPTIPVTPTLAGISEGRDEVLEKAIDVLSNVK